MIKKSTQEIIHIIKELLTYPTETEWIEFKRNNKDPQEIGEYISALSNSAAINAKPSGYLLWGIDDATHTIVGTSFSPSHTKIGNQELENWLLSLLEPKLSFRFYEVSIEEKRVVLLEIEPAFKHPVKFKKESYIRVGSYKKKLKDMPQKEKELWVALDKTPFERGIAASNLSMNEIEELLDVKKYFELLQIPQPTNLQSIIDKFLSEDFILYNGQYSITNLGAILFAKDLNDFKNLKRKAIRVVIEYQTNTKIVTKKEKIFTQGYALSFEKIIEYITDILPSNEIISLKKFIGKLSRCIRKSPLEN